MSTTISSEASANFLPDTRINIKTTLVLLITVYLGFQHPCYAIVFAEYILDIIRNYALTYFAPVNGYWQVFILLFLFRYLRLVVNTIAFWQYKPYFPKLHPTYTAKDVTVIVPTVDPTASSFKDCIVSILNTLPAQVIIVAAGEGKNGRSNYDLVCQEWAGTPGLQLVRCRVSSKRAQVAAAIPTVSIAVKYVGARSWTQVVVIQFEIRFPSYMDI